MRFKSVIEDSLRNDSMWIYFFWYMFRVIIMVNKNLVVIKYLYEVYNLSKFIIFRVCVCVLKLFEWKFFFLNWC